MFFSRVGKREQRKAYLDESSVTKSLLSPICPQIDYNRLYFSVLLNFA